MLAKGKQVRLGSWVVRQRAAVGLCRGQLEGSRGTGARQAGNKAGVKS